MTMRARSQVRTSFLTALVVAMLSIGPTFAVQPDEMLTDPALEARARVLSRELRCMVCQNQSIDDSDAPLAKDLRLLVREQLKGGSTDQQVLDFLVARYGEFVLLNPRVTAHSVLLWVIPFGILVFGAAAIVLVTRRRGSLAHDSRNNLERLTANEQQRINALLDASDRNS